MKSDAKIIVAVRKRPLTKKELAKNEGDVVDIHSEDTLVVKEMRQKVDLTKYIEEHTFTFDAVFSENEDNEAVYNTILQPLVASAFNKAKVTCFAYGQTGSGKTFTMMGSIENGIPGLYLMAANDIFQILENPDYAHIIIGISFYEIYCGKAHDLLNNREHCPIRVDAKENVNIVGLKEKIITNTESLMALINHGMGVRVTGATGANDDSSRSHAILQITLRNKKDGKLHGRMSFIDLAGSERGADVTETNKQTRLDGAEINKSLLALKECIRALDLGGKHLPFRGSKLTLVLKDSFVGNCKTVMIGNISPAMGSCEHTLNTLRYSDRVKELKKSGEGGKQLSDKDNLARALMLPRMNKNSNKIALNNQKTVDDNIVFEAFDVNTNAKNKMNIDSIKPQNHMDRLLNRGAPDGNYHQDNMSNVSSNQQDQNSFYKRNVPRMANNKKQNFDDGDDYEVRDVDIDYDDETNEMNLSSHARNYKMPPQPTRHPQAQYQDQRNIYQEQPSQPLVNHNGRGVSPVNQKFQSKPEFSGLRNNNIQTENSSSLIRKNLSIEEQTYKSQLNGQKFVANSFLASGQKPIGLNSNKDKLGNNTFGGNGLQNKGFSDKDPNNNSFVNRNNGSEFVQSSNKKMQIESTEGKNYEQGSHMNSRTFAMISEEQDDLIEEHSNQIDDVVACIKEDMAILKNVKDTRIIISN
jgi:kinesin family protein 2/24